MTRIDTVYVYLMVSQERTVMYISIKKELKKERSIMGCFSWIFADTGRPLFAGHKAYLVLPDGGDIFEPRYDCYGHFGGLDVYSLVAQWNREYLSHHPEHFLINEQKEIGKMEWYPYYADLKIPNEKLISILKANQIVYECFEYRDIGIVIACNDEDNASLPFPIKICQYKKNAVFNNLNPSLSDEGQGR